MRWGIAQLPSSREYILLELQGLIDIVFISILLDIIGIDIHAAWGRILIDLSEKA